MHKIEDYSEIAENKIFILYFIWKISMPIGDIQLIKIMLENRFMNYFYLQQYLSELTREMLIDETLRDGHPHYEINKRGLDVLHMFENILPIGLKKRVEQSILPLKKRIRMETLISADYTLEDDNSYSAHCKIKENDFTLLEVKVTAGSKEDARNICRNWTSFPQEVYSEILETLLKQRNTANDPKTKT